ncbi:MAG: c-type cytochrome [Longimicrobiales bacterium]|nr:c-type cytochrome [Longimicrobiales bacterium]
MRDPICVALLILCVSAPRSTAHAQDTSALTPLQIERTERLLETRIACRGCHIIAGDGGAIGPVLDGISDRADLTYVRAVIADPAKIPGSIMPHQPMSDGDQDRLARYLHQQPLSSAGADAPAPQAPTALMAGEEEDGASLYTRHCAACHGDSGNGDGWNSARLPVQPTRHADPTLMSLRPDDTLYDGIAAGGYVLDRSARMPAFGNLLSDAQIRTLVAHIRTLCACTQPAWSGGAR